MSELPTVLHESTGLRIVRNPQNGMVVATLHYLADPAKRTPEWKKEAMLGLTKAQFEQEYEISYTAQFGEKVFPEITDKQDKIVVKAPYPDLSPGIPCWGGFDYGARNPSSFHVYAILDGVLYSVWELFGPCRSVPEFAGKMRACPYWPQIRYIAADPSIWYETQQLREGTLTSIHQLFVEQKVNKFVKGIRDEAAWVATMRKHWAADPPTFRIFDLCPNQIREFESAIYSSMSDKQMQTQNWKENIAGHDNHSLDDCKYLMNSNPRSRSVEHKAVKTPMWKRWLK